MIHPELDFDVSTVLSILPITIHETKPGLIPGDFILPAVEAGDIYLLPVGRCNYPVYLDESRPSLLVPSPSDEVARSIVNDYKQASLLYAVDESEPGLAWVREGFSNSNEDKAKFREKHVAILERTEKLQANWFEALVKTADDSWSEDHLHNHISDLSRIAAIRLGLSEKEWLVREQVEKAQSRCRFCFTMIHQLAVICPSCHADLTSFTYRNMVTGGQSHEPSAV